LKSVKQKRITVNAWGERGDVRWNGTQEMEVRSTGMIVGVGGGRQRLFRRKS
jgi:hypothetical protein